MSKVCSSCGADNPNKAKFCRKCGQQNFESMVIDNGIEINEDDFYEQAWLEVEQETQIKNLWARAFAQSGGNEEKTKAVYLQLRVNNLKTDVLAKANLNKQQAKKKTEDIEINKDIAKRELKSFLSTNGIFTTKKISELEYCVGYQSSPRDSNIKFINGRWRIV